MIEMITIITCIITLILLKIFLNINFKNIKQLELDNFEDLNQMVNKFPQDTKMCEEILEKLNVKNVKVKLEPEYNSCLYTIFNNTITLGKFKQSYMKTQTISHECIHASQNKRILWINFIFSNIYLLYFIIVTVLALLNKLPNTSMHIIILIFLSIIQYVVRFSLENEAMIKAKYIAKKYIQENNILDKDETNKLFIEYDKINNIGIPFMNYYLISMNIVKIIIFSFVCLI